MSRTTHFRSTLATVAGQPQDLQPGDATAAVDAGLGRYNDIEFQAYVYWLLTWTEGETREAIRTAYLTIGERMGA